MKEQSAQKPTGDRSAKDTKDQHNRSAATKSRSTTGQATSEQQKPSDTKKDATSDQPKSSPSMAQQNDKTRQNTTSNNATPANNTAEAFACGNARAGRRRMAGREHDPGRPGDAAGDAQTLRHPRTRSSCVAGLRARARGTSHDPSTVPFAGGFRAGPGPYRRQPRATRALSCSTILTVDREDARIEPEPGWLWFSICSARVQNADLQRLQ
jgi:hypothetical protein